MQLENRRGVVCDACAAAYQDQFIYYSLDFRHIEVKENRFPNAKHPVIYSLDLCERCFADICERVKKNYKPTAIGMNCDLDGAELRGTFVFYDCVVARANVAIPDSGRATVSIDQRVVEFAVCQPCYRKLVDRALQLRSIASTFSTSTG